MNQGDSLTNPEPRRRLAEAETALAAMRSDQAGAGGPDAGQIARETSAGGQQIACEHREYLQAVLDSINDAVFVDDADTGQIIDVNRSMCEMYGYTREEALRAPIGDLSQGEPPYSQAEALEWLRKAREIGPQTFEWLAKHKDGHLFWVEVSIRFAVIGGRNRFVVIVRDISEHKQAEEKIRESEETYRNLFHNAQVGLFRTRITDGKILESNEQLARMFGYDSREAFITEFSTLRSYVDPGTRERMLRRLQKDGSVKNFEARFRRKDGSIFWARYSAKIYPDKGWLEGVVEDITERKQSEALLACQTEVLEQIATGASLATTLTSLLHRLELLAPDTRCSVLLLDEDGVHLLHGAAPSLPEGYTRAVEGVAIGPNVGSCGTAVFRREPVIVENIATDPLWKDYRDLALAHGLRACWSTPIFDEQRRVLGTFAIYFMQPGRPSPWHLQCIEMATHLAAVAITKQRKEEKVQAALHRSRSQQEAVTTLATLPAIAVGDLAGAVGQITELAARVMGVERVGIWLLNDQGDELRCIDLYESSLNRHTAGAVLQPHEFRGEFDALIEAKYVAADDPLTDTRRAGYVEGYLKPLGITSMLDAAIRARGRPLGVIGFEHVHRTHHWEPDEIAFACQVGDQIALLLLNRERKQAEEALRESEERFRRLFANSLVGIYRTTPDGRILLANPALVKMLRYPSFEALTQVNLEQEVFHPQSPRRLFKEAIERDGVVRGFESTLVCADGTTIHVRESAQAVCGPDGRTAYYEGVVEDITEQRRLEEELCQAQKLEAIGQLAGGVAHDFNNILAVILMQSDLITAQANLPEAAVEGIQQIRAAAERAANLTRQLLLFSRRQVMQRRDLDLNEVVTNLAKMLQRIIGEDIRLDLHLHPAPLMTRADAGMLDQVLMNLAVNARDAMRKGGRLIIETTEKVFGGGDAAQAEVKPGRYVGLRVRDTGCGIPPEIASRIFEPFFTTKQPGEGTGLGLATVLGIVKQHGGCIQVASTAGRGTIFEVYLPALAESATGVSTHESRPAPRGGTETILLVEDDAAVRSVTRAVLERHGYRVLEAADGMAALKLWQEHRQTVALLLTDLVMPGGLNGRELARRLQADRPGLKVIFNSGYSAELAGRELPASAGEVFLQKPWVQDQLLQTVRTCLDG